MSRKPISLEVAKFLGVRFCIPGISAVYKFTRTGTDLSLRRLTASGNWVESELRVSDMDYAERMYGLELYEDPPSN